MRLITSVISSTVAFLVHVEMDADHHLCVSDAHLAQNLVTIRPQRIYVLGGTGGTVITNLIGINTYPNGTAFSI